MLAIIRATLSGAPGSSWSDATVRALFDPTVPYSLAHYWTRTSFSSVDLRYVLFPTIAYADPRADKSAGDGRRALVEAALAEVSRLFDPDWDLLDQAVLLFEGGVDMFGGGTYTLPTRPGSDRVEISAAVVDALSPFGSMAQELGHAFGFAHEIDGTTGSEYASPYSVMSAARWPNHWIRLPDATLSNLPLAALGRDEPLRTIGPYIAAAQFVAKGVATLDHPASVLRAPADLSAHPWPFRLVALDQAIADWPSRRPVVAVVPAASPGAKTFFLEVRRALDYDQGLSFGLGGLGTAGLVIHSYDPVVKRIAFESALGFSDQMGDSDYRSFRGRFIVRVLGYDPQTGEASLRLHDGESWREMGVDFEGPTLARHDIDIGAWQSVNATPCGPDSAGLYDCRTVTATTDVSAAAVSHGFEKPYYQWSVNDTPIEPSTGRLELLLPAKRLAGQQLEDAGIVTCEIQVVLTDNQLRLGVISPWAGMTLRLKVVVSESSQEVLQNAYPAQTVATDVRIDNVRVAWEDRFVRARVDCWRRHWHLDKGPQPGRVKLKFDREPQFDPRLDPDFRVPEVADAVVVPAVIGQTPGEASVPALSGPQLVDQVRRVDADVADLLQARLAGVSSANFGGR